MFQTARRSVLQVAAWEGYRWLRHGFSTRLTGDFGGWPAAGEVGAAFAAPGCGLAFPQQVHAARYAVARRAWGAARPEADAVLTNRSGVLVGVRTADCVPILLVDPVLRAVGAVHAGWRGAAAGVAPHAVAGMEREFGSRPRDLEAAIGPGIAACCFEVGDEVAARFGGEFVGRCGRRPHVDLAGALAAQLEAAGVGLVAASRECTSCNTAKFFSHRAERGRAGRMLAVVGLRPEGSA